LATAPEVDVASTVTVPGPGLKTGPVESLTVTLNELGALVLLERSVAVQLTGVAPTENGPGEGGLQVTVGDGSTMSLAETRPEKSNDVFGPVAETSWAPGTETVGAVVSVTVTRKVPSTGPPRESVPEHATVVAPTGKSEPDAGRQVTVQVASGGEYVTTFPPAVSPSYGPRSGYRPERARADANGVEQANASAQKTIRPLSIFTR
jgi:hypothetical protein